MPSNTRVQQLVLPVRLLGKHGARYIDFCQSFWPPSSTVLKFLPAAQCGIHNSDDDIGLILNLWDGPLFQNHFVRALVDYGPHFVLYHCDVCSLLISKSILISVRFLVLT